MMIQSAEIPLSLYIHIPWCIRKCPYCDFNSHETAGCPDAMGYVRALLADLALEAGMAGEREVATLFIGGGTPSLFPPEAIRTLLLGVRQRVNLAVGAEITMEANPGAVEREWFSGYRDAGVNRLSIGIQSFDDEALQRLGRIHSADQACAAIEQALSDGFDSVNLDLMFGLPGQDLTRAGEDLQRALAFRPDHLSYYQLTIEPNTLFHARPPELPEEDVIAMIQEAGQSLLREAGYTQYEVSAYARAGRECRHNLNYWLFGDYLGIGAGAHGKTSTGQGVIRSWRVRHPQDYLRCAGARSVIAGERRLTASDLALEFMMNALRLYRGFPIDLFESRTGLAIDSLERPLQAAVERGLLQLDQQELIPTPLGRLYLNELLQLFCD